jgi:hypothetical protein
MSQAPALLPRQMHSKTGYRRMPVHDYDAGRPARGWRVYSSASVPAARRAAAALAARIVPAAGVRGGRSAAGAVCPRGSAAQRARRGAGDGSTGTAKTLQPTGTGWPAGSRPGPLAQSAAGPPAAGAEGLQPGTRGGDRGTVSRTGRPLSRVRQPVGTASSWRVFGLLATPLCGVAVVVVPALGLTEA